MKEIDWQAFSRVFDIFSSENYSPVLRFFYLWIVEVLEGGVEEALEVAAGDQPPAAEEGEQSLGDRFHEGYFAAQPVDRVGGGHLARAPRPSREPPRAAVAGGVGR